MSLFRRLVRRVPSVSTSHALLALDIGTEYAKALVFETGPDGRALVTGVGRKRQGLSHMQSGTVADISAVVVNCREALDAAETMAGRTAPKVVVGIAGELVKGFTTTRSVERKRPDSAVTHSELERLLEEVEADASAEAQRTITWETGLPNVDVRLVHASVAGAAVDGYAVTNPVGFQGRHLRVSVFNAYAPLVHLGALESVVEQLGLQLIKVVAEPYAVARSISGEQVGQSGALFIDVGGGTTDVALVRNGSVEGTRMFALGGRAFTKSLADRLDTSFEEAERIKIDHALGSEVARRRRGGRDRRRGRGRLGRRDRAGARGVRQGGPVARSHRALRRWRRAAGDPRRPGSPWLRGRAAVRAPPAGLDDGARVGERGR